MLASTCSGCVMAGLRAVVRLSLGEALHRQDLLRATGGVASDRVGVWVLTVPKGSFVASAISCCDIPWSNDNSSTCRCSGRSFRAVREHAGPLRAPPGAPYPIGQSRPAQRPTELPWLPARRRYRSMSRRRATVATKVLSAPILGSNRPAFRHNSMKTSWTASSASAWAPTKTPRDRPDQPAVLHHTPLDGQGLACGDAVENGWLCRHALPALYPDMRTTTVHCLLWRRQYKSTGTE